MDVKKTFTFLNKIVNQTPFIGWMILIIFTSCVIVTSYTAAYHFGQFLASQTH
ncbi:hypothetical protein PAECIP111893_00306 [Paenibacillus plantiphilus]|uniref:Uncharacterized protein n=1 Tax=Paenibacillus plantiphilus TaxID=2905650 RepID=A0ABN8FZ26_9BACL|nr:hypothetical protein PAECIP111893_00306 [Paenibacillus plantiphilus]